MNLESKVVFECDVHKVISVLHRFGNLDELKTIIKKQGTSEIPYSIDIVRRVIVFNRDKKNNGIIYSPNGIKVADEKISFIVSDALMYPKDIRAYLQNKYGSIFNFNSYVKDENLPMTFDVFKRFSCGLRKPNGAPSNIEWHDLDAHHLTQNDTVINSNFCEIWPNKTGKTPVALTEMLSRTKEIIR